MQACRDKSQTLKFAAVGAHHQNGHAERRIREIQDLARTMLIHANKRWRSTITTNLWPYAIRMANEVLNNTPSMQHKDRRSPLQIFANTKVAINPKHWHPFGYPVYVLHSTIQNNAGIFHKWRQKSEAGIYLGISPIHSKNVALVLSRKTGLISLQFHVKFDDTFITTPDLDKDKSWQIKAGFVSKLDTPSTKPRQHQQSDITKLKPSKRLSITASVGDTTYNINQKPISASESNVLPEQAQLPVDGYILFEQTKKSSEGGDKQHHKQNKKRERLQTISQVGDTATTNSIMEPSQ